MRVSTALWSVVLAGSLAAIGLGFTSGRSYARAALQPQPLRHAPAPEPERARTEPRILRGADSLDAAGGDADPFGDVDTAVAARPAGWAPASFDAKSDLARIAVVLVGADRDARELESFAAAGAPVAVVVPADPAQPIAVAPRGGRVALVDCRTADPAAIAALRRAGAAGIACSTDDDGRARALVAANGDGLVLDDRLDGDALYRAARAAHRRALTRDVLADARDDDAYVDFLLSQALAIARRSGVATVALHVRESSRRALERFAPRAERDGARLVPLADLPPKDQRS